MLRSGRRPIDRRPQADSAEHEHSGRGLGPLSPDLDATEGLVGEPPFARSGRRPEPLLVIALVGAILGGAALRLWILTSPLGAADSDEAVVGLMARHLLHGHASPFYWGQPYGGMQEPGFVAGAFALVGSSTLALKLVPIALSSVAALLVWRIGRRTVGERGAVIAAVVFWAAPTAFVWLSTKERGFYGTTVVLGLLVVLLVLRLTQRASWRDAAALGLASGCGWYANPQVIYLVLPSLVWLVWSGWRGRRTDLLRLWWVAAFGAVVGAAPWLVANVHSDWASLAVPTTPVPTTYVERLELFFRTGLPIVLGLKVPYGGHWLVPGAAVIYALALAVVVIAVARRGYRCSLLVLIAGAYPFLVSVPPTSFYLIEPRYLYFLWPVLAILAGRVLADLRPFIQVTAVVALVLGAAVGTASLMEWSRNNPRNYDLAAGDIGPLLSRLQAEKVSEAFADYWVAYRINLETREKVTAASLGYVRYAPYQDVVRASENPAYVLFEGSGPDERLAASLDELSVAYRRLRAGQYVIYLPEAAVLPEDVPTVW